MTGEGGGRRGEKVRVHVIEERRVAKGAVQVEGCWIGG